MSSKNFCCVPGCASSGESHPVLHVFPNPKKDIDRFRLWVHNIGGDIVGLDDNTIYKNRRVCHRHFEVSHCCRFNKLSRLAVPRLCLPGLSTIPRFTMVAQRRSLSSIENIDDQLNIPTTSKESKKQGVMDHVIGSQQSDLPPDLPIFEGENKENSSAVPILTEKHSEPSSVEHFGRKSLKLAGKAKRIPSTPRLCLIGKKRITSNEHKLYLKLVQTQNKLSKLRSKSKRQTASIKAARKLSTNSAFLSALESLNSKAKILTMMQFREHKKKNKGRRFTLQEKILALTIFKQTPKGYRYLRKIYILPAPQTLAKLITEANIKPGINENIFLQLKKATENMKTAHKLCVLIFDEMYLKANVCYNERKDKVSGFVTDGFKTHDDFADHAQVFMVRGLVKNYKQAVSYSFSSSSTKAPELAVQIKTIVKEIQDAGLIVMATICDQGANNRLAIKLLLQESNGNLLRKGEEPNRRLFIINNHEIIPLYDPPHLLKCIRNNLLTKDLVYYNHNNEKKTAKWEHIKLLHNENPGYKGVRLIPKMTDNHVIPHKISKMKVKYASQIFSKTVASNMGYLADKGILPKECQETADLLLLFDKLFDSCNGSCFKKDKIHGKPLLGPVTPNSVHHKVWSDGQKSLKKMKFVHNTTGKVENVPSLHNWAWTLEGFEILLKKINDQYDISSVWMRHLNQDPIENFFGAIRSHGCRNTNPTCNRFEEAFATLLINNVSSVHAPGNNCENDLCENLNMLLLSNNKDCKATSTAIAETLEIKDLSEKQDRRIISVLQYVSGYFIRNCKKKIFKTCNVCKRDLIAEQGAEYIRYREYEGRQWLCSPTEPVVELISNIQEISNFVMKNFICENNIRELIKTYIFSFLTFDFINCTEHKDDILDYLVNTTTKFFIHSYCKDLNKILCGKREVYDEDDKMQVKAKKYHKKCFKRPIK